MVIHITFLTVPSSACLSRLSVSLPGSAAGMAAGFEGTGFFAGGKNKCFTVSLKGNKSHGFGLMHL